MTPIMLTVGTTLPAPRPPPLTLPSACREMPPAATPRPWGMLRYLFSAQEHLRPAGVLRTSRRIPPSLHSADWRALPLVARLRSRHPALSPARGVFFEPFLGRPRPSSIVIAYCGLPVLSFCRRHARHCFTTLHSVTDGLLRTYLLRHTPVESHTVLASSQLRSDAESFFLVRYATQVCKALVQVVVALQFSIAPAVFGSNRAPTTAARGQGLNISTLHASAVSTLCGQVLIAL